MRLKSLTDDPALLLVLAAASHRSFRPPWGHPRYPARDGGAERLVLSPKRPLERGFFVRHDGAVEEEPHTGSEGPAPRNSEMRQRAQARLRESLSRDAARQLQTKERRPELPTRDRPWNEPRQRKWGDHEENRRAQDGNGSLHGGSRHSLRTHSNLPFMVSRRHPGADTLAMLSQKRKTAHD